MTFQAAQLAVINHERQKAASMAAAAYESAVELGLEEIACRAASMAFLNLNFVSKYEETAQWFSRVKAFDGRVTPRAQSWIWKVISEEAMGRDDFETAIAYAQRVTRHILDDAGQGSSPAECVQALVVESVVTSECGRPVAARRLLLEADRIARRVGLQYAELRIAASPLALLSVDLGTADEALRTWQPAIDKLGSMGQLVPERAWYVGALACALLGDHDAAMDHARRTRARGIPIFSALATRLEGCMHHQAGQLEQALQAYRASWTTFQGLAEERNTALSAWMYATALAEAGQARGDRRLEREADALLTQSFGPVVADTRARILHDLCAEHVEFIRTGTGLQVFEELGKQYAAEPGDGDLPAHWRWTQLRYRMLANRMGAKTD